MTAPELINQKNSKLIKIQIIKEFYFKSFLILENKKVSVFSKKMGEYLAFLFLPFLLICLRPTFCMQNGGNTGNVPNSLANWHNAQHFQQQQQQWYLGAITRGVQKVSARAIIHQIFFSDSPIIFRLS
jgi:hypothetical protein